VEVVEDHPIIRGEFYPTTSPPKTTCLEVFMVNNLVLRWPTP